MKAIFTTYQHSTIGFPKVILKWHEENGKALGAYVTRDGIIIGPWAWHNDNPVPFYPAEIERFDHHVRAQYADDPSVQG
jgi:hypothetical protein